ncbi:MAG: hypothetical protein O7A65_04470 [Proteobacteria bacterium]|nr:hypothetical protein [Pseudomonadota bacterium]
MMPIKDMLRLVASFLAVPLLASSTAASAEDEPYPVWWSPTLGLESLDRIDGRLEEPFSRDDRLMLHLYDNQATSYDTWLLDEKEARDCASLIEWTDKGYESERADEQYDYLLAYNHHRNLAGDCYAIRAMKDAKPSRESYLRNFTLDDNALKFLPAITGPWDCSNYRKMMAANRDGVSWARYQFYQVSDDLHYVASMESETSLWVQVVASNAGYVGRDRIRIMGRGDFDGDGVDDLLLGKDSFAFGEQEFEGLYLTTRDQTGATLRVIGIYGPLSYDKECLILAYGPDAPGREP